MCQTFDCDIYATGVTYLQAIEKTNKHYRKNLYSDMVAIVHTNIK